MFSQTKVPEGAEIMDHWFTLVPKHHFSVTEFYDSVSEQIADQKMPGLESSRVDLSEGGVLSDKREYLRFSRERLRFDVCAAPVGVNFIFSYRFYALPAVVKPLEVVVLLGILAVIFSLASQLLGMFLGPSILVGILILAVWFMRNAIGMGLRDLDAALLNAPLIGSIYERYLRRDTFYRQDMRIAYCSIVSGIVKNVTEVAMGAQGLRLGRTYEYSPRLERYRSVSVTPPADPVQPPE